MKIALLPTLTLSLFWIGCESVKSSDVSTASIYADLSAATDGDGTLATAILKVGGGTSNTYVELSEGDTLSVSAGEETEEMFELSLGDFYYYNAELSADEAGTEVLFAFDRSTEESAPESRCSLPEPFEITSPAPETAFSRSTENIEIAWDPSGTDDSVHIEVEGDCIFDLDEYIGDSGSFAVTAEMLEDATEPAEACSGNIRVIREREGALDPAYGEGGRVLCAQVREIPILLNP